MVHRRATEVIAVVFGAGGVVCCERKINRFSHQSHQYYKEGPAVDKNILLKALINGVLAWIGIALIMMVMKGAAFTTTLLSVTTICIGLAAALGSYIGYVLKQKKG